MDGPLKLTGTVGRFDSVERDDILAMKTALNWAGY